MRLKLNLSSLGDLAEKVYVESNPTRLMEKFPQPDFIIHDIESNGLHPFKPAVPLWNHRTQAFSYTNGAVPFAHFFGVYSSDKDRLYVAVLFNHETELLARFTKQYLENPRITKIGHNYKFDMTLCRRAGIRVKGPIFDTLTASRLLYDRLPRHDLKYLGGYFTGASIKDDTYEKDVKQFLKKLRDTERKNHPEYIAAKSEKRKISKELSKRVKAELDEKYNYSCIPDELLIPYGVKDIVYTFVLFMQFATTIEGGYSKLFQMEMELIRLVIDMEYKGIRLDAEYCRAAYKKCRKLARRNFAALQLELKKYGVPNLNIRSSKQMLGYMDMIGIPPKELINKKKKISADKEVMERLGRLYPENKLFESLLQYRAYLKLADYFAGFSKFTGKYESPRLHCDLKISDTVTGRTACKDPNLQNIPNPKEVKVSIRESFIPAKGYRLLLFDYSQIEMKVFALFCQDPKMLEGLRTGADFHDLCSMMIFGNAEPDNRKFCKAINFGLIYGMGLEKLANTLNIGMGEARAFKERYLDMLPGMQNLARACKRMIYERGFVEDTFGRRYHVPMEESYKAVNALVQGCSANVLKMAMLQLNRLIQYHKKYLPESALGQYRILLPIHDELIIEAKEEHLEAGLYGVPTKIAALIKTAMEHIVPITRYGIHTDVEPSHAVGSWQNKQAFPLPESANERAKAELKKLNAACLKKTGKPILFDESFAPAYDWFYN